MNKVYLTPTQREYLKEMLYSEYDVVTDQESWGAIDFGTNYEPTAERAYELIDSILIAIGYDLPHWRKEERNGEIG